MFEKNFQRVAYNDMRIQTQSHNNIHDRKLVTHHQGWLSDDQHWQKFVSFSSRFCFERQTEVTSAAVSCMLSLRVPPFRSVQITLYNSYTVWPAHPVQLNYEWTSPWLHPPPWLHHEKVKCSNFTALSHRYVSFLSFRGCSRSTVNTGHNLKYARVIMRLYSFYLLAAWLKE